MMNTNTNVVKAPSSMTYNSILKKRLKQAERQSKPVGLYVVLVVLVAIIIVLSII